VILHDWNCLIRSLRIPIAAGLVLLCLSPFGSAQATGGSSTMDIDEISGIGTATCETDLDAVAQNYYQAEVHCTVTDFNGTQVAHGEKIDDDFGKGFAQVVLIFPCIPGTTYQVTANHLLVVLLDEFGQPGPGELQGFVPYDLFNFRFYETTPGDYFHTMLLTPGPYLQK